MDQSLSGENNITADDRQSMQGLQKAGGQWLMGSTADRQ